MSEHSAEKDAPQAQRQTARRKVVARLRYSGKPGTLRLARVLEARDIAHAVMAATGTEWGGDYGPPFAPTRRYPWQGEERVFANNNDGSELWFGYPDHWEWHIGSDEIRRLTRYLIVDYWLRSRWLGLRRPIYYVALHHAVNRTRKTRVLPPEVGDGA